MMNFQQYKNWVKNHRVVSFILILLFLLGIVWQIRGAIEWFKEKNKPTEYRVIDIHFDRARVEAEEIEEGIGMGSSLYRVFLNKRGTSELISMIRDNPNDTYLINLKGTTPINEQWMLGDKFALELYGICGLKAAQEVGATEDLDGFCESIILHFSSQKTMDGWNSFSEGPASCCDNYFHLKGFYRFTFIGGKLDRLNHYQVKYIEPDPDIAIRTIQSLEAEKYFQIYADK